MDRRQAGVSIGLCAVVLAGLVSVTAQAQSPAISSGLQWLQAQVQTDGSVTNAQGIATDFQADSETLDTLQTLQATTAAQASLTEGLINADPDTGTENLSRKIIATTELGQDASGLVTTLLADQNADGGFGDDAGYQSTAFDTAYALQALNAAGQGNTNAAYQAASYLLNQQQSDGSWADLQGIDIAYNTAVVMQALAPYRTQFTAAGSALTAGIAYLKSVQQTGSDWGVPYINAAVVIALAGDAADPSLVKAAATDLAGTQLADGSWVDDPFSTALALRALAAADGTAVPTQAIGAVEGYVVEAGTGQPIAGATVFVASNSTLTTTTNAEGYYTLSNLPAGQLTLVANADGYSAATTAASVVMNTTSSVAKLVLAQNNSTGMVFGRITSQQDGTVIAGAAVQLTGPGQYQATSDAKGAFVLPSVMPGNYTLSVSATGFIAASGSIGIDAGNQYQVNQSLLLSGSYQGSAPVTVTATVVDGVSGNAIPGAALSLTGSLSGSTASDGSVSIGNVPTGSYQATVSAPGYATGNYTFVLVAGTNGALGTLTIYPLTGDAAATTLTIIGTVVSGLGNQPLAGATITRMDTGQTLTSGADGSFTLSGLTGLNVTLQVSDPGYTTELFTLTASGYGTVAQTLALPPSSSTGATSVQLAGTVTDSVSGAAISNATVALSDGSETVTTGSNGAYQLSGIANLSFKLVVSASGYVTQTVPVTLSQFGNYTLNLPLTPAPPASTLQVLSVTSTIATLTTGDTGVFNATVGNTGSADVSTILIAEITNSQGNVVADVGGKVPGASTTANTFTVPANGQVPAEFDWAPEQLPPGNYTVTVYATTPGTVTRANPLGTVLASGNTSIAVGSTELIGGQLGFSPPLVQAGTQNPVSLSALVVNTGNTDLPVTSLHLTVTDPNTGSILYSADAQAPLLPVNNNTTVSFGDWLPTAIGNLKVTVTPVTSGVAGEIDGTLYVGNKATAQFTVDRTIVSPGTNTVHAKVAIQGVDVSQAISTDPLFFAVQRAVTNGGAYVGANAVAWGNSHQCLGCHIQTQSAMGLASSLNKANISLNDLKYLVTEIASSQHNDGTYDDSMQWTAQTQTLLGLWALNPWPDHGSLLRNKLAAAMYIHQQRATSGDKVWWNNDYNLGWWEQTDGLDALAIKDFADVLSEASGADLSRVVTYSWGTGLAPSGSVSAGRDLAVGPDGRLYAAEDNGTISWVDPATGSAGTVSLLGLPNNANGIAVAADGSFYVSGNGYIAHGVPGQQVTFLWKGAGNISDVTLAPSGVLYAVNQDYSQLLRFDGNVPTVILGYPTLNHPVSIAFDSSGNGMIANSSNKNIIELAADGTVSVWASGLTAPPLRITYDGDGGWYVITDTKYIYYYGPTYEDRGLYHFTSDGVGERLLDAPNFVGVAVQNGRVICVDRNHNTLVPLATQPIDPAELDDLRQDVAGAARYLLGVYNDGNTNRMVNALRLIGLGEARRVVTDPTLLDSINQAISYLDARLRGYQNPDGGWGSPHSDPIVTALVGLGLDYTNPSAGDPATRNAIQYLLNSQAGDGSWYSPLNVMSTRLAITSLVMAYMPQALERLGGLDVDLQLTDTSGSTFSTLNPSAGSVTVDNQGHSTYDWHLTGVTSSGQDVTLDVILPNMLANETRAVAGSATLQFKNSFTNEILTTNLDIPQVKAVSGLGITVGTDRSQYPANTDVVITGVVGNNGVPTTNAQVALQITASDGTVVATLPAVTGLQIVTGAQQTYTAQWNTALYLPGTYRVTAQIVDDTGTVANTAVVAFSIASSSSGNIGGAQATLRTSTDRTTYNTTDTVNIADLVQSVTDNALLSLVHLHVVVTDPAGQTVQTYDHNLGQLAPGATVNLPDTLALNHVAQGQYGVSAQLTDSTGTTLVTGQTTFNVAEDLTKTLIGTVTVQSPQVYQGDPELCTDTVINTGTLDAANQPIRQLLVNLADGTAVSTTDSTVTLPAGQQQQKVRTIGTDSLAVGDYACVLQAEISGSWNSLGYAHFHVAPPPIKIGAGMAVGQHGRVLILTDDPAAYPANEDPFGPTQVPGLTQQNQHLLQMLHQAGWSVTLVTNATDFQTQFDTQGYEVYVILSEAVKLPNTLQDELVQAVNDGEGLIVAGNHDDRNSKLDTALGAHTTGKSLSATGLSLDSGSLDAAGGQVSFPVDAEPATVNKVSATPVGEFLLTNGGTAPAVFTYQYGNGKSIYMPFDLALEEAAAGDNSLFDQLMLDSLNYVHPATLTPYTGSVLPIVLTLDNEGIPTPGRALVTLPPGVTVIDPNGATVNGNTLTWTFDLTSKGEILPLNFWARIPDITGSIDFTTVVQSGTSPNFVDKATADLLIGVQPRPTPQPASTHQDAVITNMSAGNPNGRQQKK